jgi:hypothetical protein
MDLPSNAQLRRWYFVSLGGLLTAITTALLVRWISTLLVAALSDRQFLWIRTSLAFLLGALGTTLLSASTGLFIFTWPLGLFAVFEFTVFHSSRNASLTSNDRWHGRFAAALFISVCVAYFLICRRLGLVVEWVFLGSFIAALPPLWLAHKRIQSASFRVLTQILLSLIAFSAYYVAAVAILWIRYEK